MFQKSAIKHTLPLFTKHFKVSFQHFVVDLDLSPTSAKFQGTLRETRYAQLE